MALQWQRVCVECAAGRTGDNAEDRESVGWQTSGGEWQATEKRIEGEVHDRRVGVVEWKVIDEICRVIGA